MNKIIFNGVGMDTNKTNVGNYRIVSCFNNEKSQQCFIDISHIEEDGKSYGTIHQAYHIEDNCKKHCFRTFDAMYNIKFLLTKEEVINKVNNIFKCNFDEIEIAIFKNDRWNGIKIPNTI